MGGYRGMSGYWNKYGISIDLQSRCIMGYAQMVYFA